MSDSQTAWSILWNHAAGELPQGDCFEIGDVTPEVASALKITEDAARTIVAGLLAELDRLPEGHRYFTREGDAVVPTTAFRAALGKTQDPIELYPYEL